MDTKQIENAFEPFNGYPLVYVFPNQVTNKLFNAIESCGIYGQLTVLLASEYSHGAASHILAGILKFFTQPLNQIGPCLLKMSDNLDFIQIEQFKNSVRVSDDQCLQYVRKQCVSSENIISLHTSDTSVCVVCMKQSKNAYYKSHLPAI